jgi:hypothetical protein
MTTVGFFFHPSCVPRSAKTPEAIEDLRILFGAVVEEEEPKARFYAPQMPKFCLGSSVLGVHGMEKMRAVLLRARRGI